MVQEGNSLLHQLAHEPNGKLKEMCDSPDDINEVNAMGETPLLSLLRSPAPNLSAVCELLRARADVNRGDIMGETPLMEAACLGDRELCLSLLQSRADAERRNLSTGQRAEELAQSAGYEDIAQLCRSHGQAILAPRRRGGALRQRCEEQEVPLDLLGQLCANDLLRDIDRWQRAPWAELATEATEQGLEVTEQVERQELEVRLKKLRVWRLLPLQPLQDLCRLEAAHVVGEREGRGESSGPLSREELIEALMVASWGGVTKSQSIRKRCEEKGIPEGKLEDRQRAELILNEFDRLEQMSTGDLGRLYKSRGFAYADDMEPESLREQLKEHLLYQELSLSHLRQLCKEKELPIKGDHRRADLLKLITAESWHALEIPVMKLPSVLVAQGLLDQLKRLEKKDERQLRAELRRRQLPLEQSASKSKLLSRLRRHLVWQQMSVEDLEDECRSRDLQWTTTSKMSKLQQLHPGSLQKKEMLQLLHDWLTVEMLEGKGISVKLMGHEAALAIFMEVERLESMPRKLLEAEYQMLGMPDEPKLEDKELIYRLKQVLMWSQLEIEQLVEECQDRQLHIQHTLKLCEEEKRQILLDKLIMSLGVDGWEKQGIPVARLSSLDAAIGIIEELNRLEEAEEKEVKETYQLLGLPKETLDKSVMISRLKHYMIWQELRPSELRKECLKHSISAAGDIEELITKLVLKTAGFALPEETKAPELTFPPREPKTSVPKTIPAPSGKVASAFQLLGLDVTAKQEEVRRAYRRLALQHHPDKNPGLQEEAVKKFQQITHAYETLQGHLKHSAR